ncbi:MAG TPA: DUF4382 domain-containing protein [Bacteroidales bacterium]|nr:DUF4382 domain-containing protein [Desulfobacteraceae bacterium]MDH3722421.1 DUF4382 domain-containing protein [Desulfobacteraceae bacterium]MDH3838194.1 DUF4382 domain-containing protein [Desulfobacteraceae bacterium]MDH3876013.1 DUF4382 domain-containing protein [Desulfobacteraceae bacterium]HYX07502.1 DUF4382 domain-containing protein [Bacteroidales bacterium]
MKLYRLVMFLTIVSSFLMITACGGGSGGSIEYGEVAMHITDAKPLLPEGSKNVTNLWITFTGVLVHKSGGGWISLPLTGDPPHIIDLLQFIDGNTTEIVTPTLLEYGKYTQIRLEIESATIRFDNDVESDVVIPSDHFKTDKNFLFDVNKPGPIDIIIDFDLSQSLEVTDPFGTPSNILNPVLHIVDASKAVTIKGKIAQGSFVVGQKAEVTVFTPNSGIQGGYEEYTKIEVSESDTDPTEFSIYWIVPDEDYRVEIKFDPDFVNGVNFSEDVSVAGVEPGEVRNLNRGNPI